MRHGKPKLVPQHAHVVLAGCGSKRIAVVEAVPDQAPESVHAGVHSAGQARSTIEADGLLGLYHGIDIERDRSHALGDRGRNFDEVVFRAPIQQFGHIGIRRLPGRYEGGATTFAGAVQKAFDTQLGGHDLIPHTFDCQRHVEIGVARGDLIRDLLLADSEKSENNRETNQRHGTEDHDTGPDSQTGSPPNRTCRDRKPLEPWSEEAHERPCCESATVLV